MLTKLLMKWRAIVGTGLAGAGVGAVLGGAVMAVSALIEPGSVGLVGVAKHASSPELRAGEVAAGSLAAGEGGES